MPMDSAAMEMRPPSRMRRLSTKPSPRFAEQLRRGRRQFGEDHFAGGAGAHAELVFLLAGRKPGMPFSRMKAEMPCCAAARGR
jgi:hypothetical protein